MSHQNALKSQLKRLYLTALFSLSTVFAFAGDICYNVGRIWGDGSAHCAFTSLVAYKGAFYCTFREGYDHIFNAEGEADGKIRIITSPDGVNWESTALIAQDGCDLRDPKLSVTPDGKLMLSIARSIYKNRELMSTKSLVAFSSDGRKFTKLKEIKIEGQAQHELEWLWRVTWHEGTGYGVSYFRDGDRLRLQLLSTTDGVNYRVIKLPDLPDGCNESTVRFTADGSMLIFIRRDGGDGKTILLSSPAPYTEWSVHNTGFYCGGPDALVLPNGKILLSGRSHFTPFPKTNVYTGNAVGNFEETLVLPSSGDNSYPSLLLAGDEVWITYYSCHETAKPSIYLAKIPVSLFDTPKK